MINQKFCAVVTGGTRGIGYAIAEKLLKDGLRVIVTGTARNSIYPKGAQFKQVDFLKKNSVEPFIEFLKNEKIDVLVNNAGINKIDKFTDINISDFDKILCVNLRAPFLLSQAVIPYMKSQNWGRIINITSIFGNISKEYRAAYSSSKFGLDGMTAALASEVAEYGILANSIGPGFIDTELTKRVLGESGINKLRERFPIKRLGMASEIANFVSWLASEENTYISGQNLMIDGGFSRV